MNRIIGIALLAVGVVLLVMGFNAADSLSSELSEFFTGSPTDKAVWMIIGGMFATIVGVFATFWRTAIKA